MDKDNAYKKAIHLPLWQIYSTKGYNTLVKSSWEIMKHCERNARYNKYRQLKGEVAEIVLECALREIQKTVKPSVVLKGLCIPFRSMPGKTTELDLTLVTERMIYLFECKSYKNKPVITGDCMLNNTTDVFGQSNYHLKGLHEYIGRLYDKSMQQAPYKFILFEMSTDGVDDRRTPEAKKRVPVCNPDTLYDMFMTDYNSRKENLWDVTKTVEVLKPLVANSATTFEEHLRRLKK